jgi:hypothetical protein
MGKLETGMVAFMFANGIASMSGSVLNLVFGIVGFGIAIGSLTFRYVKNHPHNNH